VRWRIPTPDVRVHDADFLCRPVHVAPPQAEQLALREPGHGGDEVQDSVDASQLDVDQRIWGGTGKVQRGSRGDAKFAADLLPDLVLRPDRSRARAALKRCRRVPARTLACGGEQRLQLALIEEPEFGRLFARRRRFVNLVARVRASPPLADRELEDATQVGVEIADRLGGQTSVEAGVKETPDIIRVNLADRSLAEVRLEVDPDL
jgi:hypothetical protein